MAREAFFLWKTFQFCGTLGGTIANPTLGKFAACEIDRQFWSPDTLEHMTFYMITLATVNLPVGN